MRLLIAEDDVPLSRFLCRGLCLPGDEVGIAHDGDAAVALFLEREPDLLLLDLQLPGRSGRQVLAAVRDRSPLCPVLILSAIATAEMRTACLETGADDCLAKPFSLAELRARCGALLRRRQGVRDEAARLSRQWAEAGPPVLGAGVLRMERIAHRVSAGGEPLHLTAREFTLLEQLLLADGRVVGRETLRRALGTTPAEANTLDVHMAALRRKLAALPHTPAIETIRGCGYRVPLAALALVPHD